MKLTTISSGVLLFVMEITALLLLLVPLAQAFPLTIGGLQHQPLCRKSVRGSMTRKMATTIVEKTEDEWQEILTPDQFYVLRQEGTEPPNSSPLNLVKDAGTFSCAGCGSPLFTTDTKYESGTGWPSFYAPIDNAAITTSTDFKLLLPRTEVSCATCGGHLGHVFDDGPDPTGQRYCMNGVAMTFQSNDQHPELALEVVKRQERNPYRLNAAQVLPGILFNGVIGGLFFQSFVARIESAGSFSPLDLFPLLPAIYFGVMAARTCEKLKMT